MVKTFRRLLRMLAPYRWWVILAVLLSFGAIGSSVGLMAVSAYLISKAAVAIQVTDLSLAITGVRFFAISRAVLRYAERYITHRTTFRILTHLRVWFYESIEPLAPARLIQHRSGDLLARIVGDIETLEHFYARVIVPPLSAALVTLLACMILGTFSLLLAAVLLLFLLLTGVALPLATRWISRQPSALLIEARANLTAAAVDEIQGMADILAFSHEQVVQERFDRLGQDFNRIQERLAILRGMANGLAALFTGLGGLTVLWLAIPLVTAGKIEGVYLALLPLTAIAAFEAVQPLSQAIQVLEANLAAGARLFELIDALPAVSDPQTPSPQALHYGIQVEDLRFHYADDQPPVLDGLSFTLAQGGRVALVGPSGSGKSTLVSLLLRFWDIEEGKVRLGDHDLRDYRVEDVREMIAVVSQDTYLFNTTIRDNLLLANPEASDDDLVTVCRIAQVHDFIQSLPLGYNTLVGDNGFLLSGGERQRLAIARALLKEAPILILDEATAHLDALTEQRVLAGLASFMDGRSVLVINHRLTNRSSYDQIVRLN